MNSFLKLHRLSISGTINTFDRVIFKGHLNGFFPDGAFGRYLSRRGILLKDAGRFFEAETQRIRIMLCRSRRRQGGRSSTWFIQHASLGHVEEARARQIAERDGVTEGLVCVLSVVEPCRSFAVAPNRQTRRLEVVRRPRKRLHYYLYLIDPEFGWMHLRLQTWAPYEIQVYINGREWLARGRWIRPASVIGAVTTRSRRSMTSGRSVRCASGSPTPAGPRSSSARQPWSTRCCPTSNARRLPRLLVGD